MDIIPLHTKVEKEIQIALGTVVLENPKGFPRNECNLYCTNDGKIVWYAEKPQPQSIFSRLKLNEDGESIATYTTDDYACDLDIKTGKLINKTKLQ